MRLFLAGAEAWNSLLLDMGVKHQLLSFFYFRHVARRNGTKFREMMARMRLASNKGYRFMLDSGAFSYHQQAGKGTMPRPSVYFQEYHNFIAEHGDLFDPIVEFDVDGFVKEDDEEISTGHIDEWTNSLVQMNGIGHKVMPVYHDHRGHAWLRDWLTDTASPYIGLGSSAANVGKAGRLLALCHRFGKFVHGFAQTRIRTDMKFTPFDSVDSTTWLRSDRFGGSCYFLNGKFVVLDHLNKGSRRLYKQWYESYGLDYSKIMKDDLHENRMATIIAWRELGNYLEHQWFLKTGGKYPYIYQAHVDGNVPDEHPMLLRISSEIAAMEKSEGAPELA